MLAVQKSGGMSPHGPLGISAAFKRRVATGTQVPVAGAVGRGPGPVAAGDTAKGSPQPLPASGFSVLCAVSTSAAWARCPTPAADGILAMPLCPHRALAASFLSQRSCCKQGLARVLRAWCWSSACVARHVPAMLPRGQD